MALRAVNSNRYPRGNGSRSVPDSRSTRPLPSPLPHQRRSGGGIPANVNMPGSAMSPALARALRLALRASRLARLSNPVGLIAGEVLEELLNNPASQPAALGVQRWRDFGAWRVTNRCVQFDGNYGWVLAGFDTSCPLTQFPGVASYPTPEAAIAAGPNNLQISLWHQYDAGPIFGQRLRQVVAFRRPLGSVRLPAPLEVPDIVPLEIPWPQVVPLPEPVAWPVGLPRPSNPRWVRPLSRPSRNPESRIPTVGNEIPGVKPLPLPEPVPLPKPPGKGVKEKKVSGRGIAAIIQRSMGRALSGYSELGDFIESLHDALPKHLQSNGHLGDKLMALYANIGAINMAQAIQNLGMNHLEDAVVGGLIGMTVKNLGSHLGNNAVAGVRIRW